MSEHKNTCAKKKVYYNVSIPHNDLMSQGGSPTPAKFEEVRDEAFFVGKPCDWLMSVIRFSVPTTYIPIQYFPVEEDNLTPANPNKSIYSITLTYLGVDYEEHLQWITQHPSVPTPPPPTGVTEREFQFDPQYLDYYELGSYSHFATLINNAITACFNTNILGLLPAPPAGTTYSPPFFSYSGVTKRYTITYDSQFLDTTVNNCELWVNTYLNENFDTSFNTVYGDYLPVGKNARYKLIDYGDDFKTADATAVDGFVYNHIQEFFALGQMASFTSLIIRSTSLPIRNEALTLQSKGNNNGSAIGSGQESIVSDFELAIDEGNNIKGMIHYLPTAEYRRINLHGETPITRIDLEIFWKDNYDNLYPVLIPAHYVATIKILFEEQ